MERIRSLLARFPEDEEAVRELVTENPTFEGLCREYQKVVALLDGFEAQVKRLRKCRAWLEEELLTRIEGQPPQ